MRACMHAHACTHMHRSLRTEEQECAKSSLQGPCLLIAEHSAGDPQVAVHSVARGPAASHFETQHQASNGQADAHSVKGPAGGVKGQGAVGRGGVGWPGTEAATGGINTREWQDRISTCLSPVQVEPPLAPALGGVREQDGAGDEEAPGYCHQPTMRLRQGGGKAGGRVGGQMVQAGRQAGGWRAWAEHGKR